MHRLLSPLAALLFLTPLAAAPQDDQEKADGFKPLFNGRDLTGWKQFAGKKDVWKIEGDLVVCAGRGRRLAGHRASTPTSSCGSSTA